MKTLKAKSNFFFSFILILSLVLVFGIGITQLAPIGIADEGDVYLVSNDIIKNFQFETFDGTPVSISGESFDGKVQFESQASWRINPDDIQMINVYTQGDDVYIRYKVGMSSKINMYSILDLGQCIGGITETEDPGGSWIDFLELFDDDPEEQTFTSSLSPVTEEFLVAHYRHSGLYGDHMFSWKAYLDWTHYYFGDIKSWNDQNHIYSGDVIMSFDIAQSALPNFQTQSGDSLTKNFDYIAVSSIGVVDNKIGHLDDTAPEIVGLTPREYETEKKSNLGALDLFGSTKEGKWDANYDPNIDLVIHEEPLNSFDGGLSPQTPGSSMNPRTKSGDPIWNPEATQQSMPDCRFIYHIGKLSPLVTEYYGTLSYKYIYYETIDKLKFVLGIPVGSYVAERQNTQIDRTYTRPVGLHVTNRYIQAEIKVVFDIFCSYKIDVGSDNIEDYNLDFPMEYYDLLAWITTVDGFGGGEQHTDTSMDFLGLGSDIFTWIIIIAIIVGGVLLFIYVINPILKARRTQKIIESALRSRK